MSEDALSIEIANPIEVGGRQVTTLTFKPPKASQVRIARAHLSRMTEEAITRYQIALLALCAGVKDPVIENLGVSQMENAFRWANEYVERGLNTAPDDAPYKVITLRHPVTIGNGTTEEIHLREPNGAERRKAEAHTARAPGPEADIRKAISLTASMATISEAVVEMMDIDQVLEAYKYGEGFSERGRATGTS